TGYFVMAMPAALLMRKWGYKAGMVTGLCLFGGGMVLFWPAAVSHQYAPFLGGLFTVGGGASVLGAASGPFIAQFWAAEAFGGEAEFFAVVQSSGDDSGSADWSAVYFFGGGEDGSRDCGDARGGDVPGVSAYGDHAGGADVSGVWRCGAAVCAYFVADEVS